MKLADIPLLSEKITQNRNVYSKQKGISSQKVVSAEIVHGSETRIVSENDGGKIIPGADGLIARDKNIFLSITSADCLPIFLFEPEREIVGVIHAGWKSLAKSIIANAVSEIKKLGGRTEYILVGIGPAICQRHYEVGLEVAEKFASLGNPASKWRLETPDGKIYLDIKKIAELQLLRLGIKQKNIEISPECTYELPEKYFSARRDKPREIEAMIALIGMKG